MASFMVLRWFETTQVSNATLSPCLSVFVLVQFTTLCSGWLKGTHDKCHRYDRFKWEFASRGFVCTCESI
jgi:hypothetical protein